MAFWTQRLRTGSPKQCPTQMLSLCWSGDAWRSSLQVWDGEGTEEKSGYGWGACQAQSLWPSVREKKWLAWKPQVQAPAECLWVFGCPASPGSWPGWCSQGRSTGSRSRSAWRLLLGRGAMHSCVLLSTQLYAALPGCALARKPPSPRPVTFRFIVITVGCSILALAENSSVAIGTCLPHPQIPTCWVLRIHEVHSLILARHQRLTAAYAWLYTVSNVLPKSHLRLSHACELGYVLIKTNISREVIKFRFTDEPREKLSSSL